MFSSAAPWLIIAVGFASLQFASSAAVRLRAAILALVGVAGIIVVLRISLIGSLVLAVGLAATWLGCRLIRAQTLGSGAGLGLLAILPLLLAWLIGKLAVTNDWPRLSPLLFVGSSYVLVKCWSLIKDVRDSKVRDPDPVHVAAYILHFPTFAIGPMHYFSEFQAQLRKPYRIDGEALVDIVFRFVLGLVKINVVAGLLAPWSLIGLADAPAIDPFRLLTGAAVYSLVLYCDFSGFCDMAIAVSRLLGVDVPENFNWPFLATSIRDFWRRWHITFSRALTAHIFVPTTRALHGRLPERPGLVSALGYVSTFLLCGYWHGATANFLLWGLWHAVGLVTQDTWTRRKRRRGVKPVLGKSPLQRGIDTALTFSYVSIGWIFFVLPVENLRRVMAGWWW